MAKAVSFWPVKAVFGNDLETEALLSQRVRKFRLIAHPTGVPCVQLSRRPQLEDAFRFRSVGALELRFQMVPLDPTMMLRIRDHDVYRLKKHDAGDDGEDAPARDQNCDQHQNYDDVRVVQIRIPTD
jgi:hypothetical protein